MLSGTDGLEIVGQAAGVGEALRLFSACRPDAVVLDIQLPDGSGIDVLRTIKRDAPNCVVVVLTSHAGIEWRSACIESGADHFLEKAKEFERLGETLTSIRLH